MDELPLVYHPRQFVTPPDDELECSLCCNILCDPVDCDGLRRHTFCRRCLKRWMETRQTCPVCNCALTAKKLSTCLTLRNLIEKSQVYCFTRLPLLMVDKGEQESPTTTACQKGDVCCQWTGALRDAEKHFRDSCGYVGVRCNFEQCPEVLPRRDLPAHIFKCPYRLVACEWCTVERRDGEMEEHLRSCPQRLVPCINRECALTMKYEDLSSHYRNECPFTVVPCPYASLGCSHTMVRKDMEIHELHAMLQHNRLLLLDNRALREAVRELNTGVEDVAESCTALRGDVDEARCSGEIRFCVPLADLLRGTTITSPRCLVKGHWFFLTINSAPREQGHLSAHLNFHDDTATVDACCVCASVAVLHSGGAQCSYKRQLGIKDFPPGSARGWKQFMPMKDLLSLRSPYVHPARALFVQAAHATAAAGGKVSFLVHVKVQDSSW